MNHDIVRETNMKRSIAFAMLVVATVAGLTISCGVRMPVCTGGMCGKNVESGRAQYVAAELVSEVLTVPAAGKVTVIDFWDTRCKPCIEEMPRFEALWGRADRDRVAFVGVAMDDAIDDVRAALRAEPNLAVTFPMVHDGAEILDGIYGIGIERPVTVVIGANGAVLYDSRAGGSADHVSDVEAVLESLGGVR